MPLAEAKVQIYPCALPSNYGRRRGMPEKRRLSGRSSSKAKLHSRFHSWNPIPTITELVEKSLADLNRRVAEIEEKLGEREPGGWRAVAGKAEGDDLFEEAIRLGAEWRAKANARER